MSNVIDLKEFVYGMKEGETANVATSQYAINTVAEGFQFDFFSTPQAIRSLERQGWITAFYGWRYYEITKKG